jgi:dipeptidyl aminopeptidase/acylaminoacyl peptidase
MRCIFTVVAILIAGAPASAEAPRRVAPPASPWTLDDVLLAESAADFQVSPDGRNVVWVKTFADSQKGEHVQHLMRTDLGDVRETMLTRGPDSCHSPRWSPDGRWLAFLSARPAPRSRRSAKEDDVKEQVWLIDPTGGEPWPLTDVTRGVLRFDWAGSGALVFVAQEEPSLRASTLEEEKDDAIVVEDDAHEPPARLFRVDVESKKVTRLSTNTDRIEQLAVSPDGRHAVAIHNQSLRYVYDNKVKPAVYLHDLSTGASARHFSAPKFNISHVRWTPDGKGFYAVNDLNSQPQFSQAGIPELYYHDLASGKSSRVELDWEKGLATQGANDEVPGFALTADGFVALLADGVHNRVARFTRTNDGWRRDWLSGTHAASVFGIQTSRDGKTLLYAHSTASDPPQWYAARLDGCRIEDPRPVAVMNDHLRGRQRARAEVVRWKGAMDEEVEGILHYPHDYRPGQRRPLVVMIHGGPALADQDLWDDTWMYPVNLVCGRGALVLRPNYHGSSHYGLKWLESITRGSYGDPELVDIEKGVDELIQRGLADRERLGLIGWSNGAILCNLLTARTNRYRAASAGAGSIEYVSDWASCEFGDAFDRYYFGARPQENPEWYRRRSPFWRLDRVRTPTLIFFGTEDRTVAMQQGWLHYRGLQQLGKAPVRFVQFLGAKHVPKKLAHQKRKLVEELAWLDRYLFQSAKDANEAFKADSPLAWSLVRARARREGGHFGVLVKGCLAPETVTFGNLQIGRFEVTRAQFAAFDRTQVPDAAQENYPAAGVTFEQAKDYCAWLSRQTGRTYRLPTEQEAEELYVGIEGNENTLDHWAGYTPNPDDATRLRAKIRELPGPAPLLKEVGSFRGAGEGELVFDLGGNAAEWVAGKDGKGLLRGGSADTPAAAKWRGDAAPAVRGLRVVLTGVAKWSSPAPGRRAGL